MVLRHLVIGLAHVREGLLQVAVNHFIDMSHGATLILRVEFGLDSLHIRDTEILVTRILVVIQAEFVNQHEMGVGTAEERFRHLTLKAGRYDVIDIGRTAEVMDRLERLVGVGDDSITVIPKILRAVVGYFRNIFPPIALVDETIRARIVITDIIYIIRHVLIECQIGILQICRTQQGTDLFDRIDFRTVVRHLIQELVASREGKSRGKGQKDDGNSIDFHILVSYH